MLLEPLFTVGPCSALELCAAQLLPQLLRPGLADGAGRLLLRLLLAGALQCGGSSRCCRPGTPPGRNAVFAWLVAAIGSGLLGPVGAAVPSLGGAHYRCRWSMRSGLCVAHWQLSPCATSSGRPTRSGGVLWLRQPLNPRRRCARPRRCLPRRRGPCRLPASPQWRRCCRWRPRRASPSVECRPASARYGCRRAAWSGVGFAGDAGMALGDGGKAPHPLPDCLLGRLAAGLWLPGRLPWLLASRTVGSRGGGRHLSSPLLAACCCRADLIHCATHTAEASGTAADAAAAAVGCGGMSNYRAACQHCVLLLRIQKSKLAWHHGRSCASSAGR